MKNKKGFTIIEVIVSIAIVGIIAISLLSIFNTGLTNIVRAGVRTEAVNKAEEDLLNEPTIISPDTITIKLPSKSRDGNDNVDITGSYAKGTVTVNQGQSTQVQVEIEAFIPGLIGNDTE